MYSAWRKLTNVLIRIAPVYLAASISIVSANNEDLVWEIIDA
jgi:hypothetical protein